MDEATQAAARVAGAKQRQLPGHSGRVLSLDWAPDGALLGSSSSDLTARLWSVAPTGQAREMQELRGHSRAVEVIRWASPACPVTTSEDKSVRAWDVRSGKATATYETNTGNIALACSPDGRLAAVSDRNDVVSLIDLRKDAILSSLDVGSQLGCQVNEIKWDKSSSHLFLSTGFPNQSKGGFEVLDTRAPELKRVVGGPAHTGNCYCIDFSNGPEPLFALGCTDALVSLWNADDLTCVGSFTRSDAAVRAISFSHDGSVIAYGSLDKFILLDDVATGEGVGELDASSVAGVNDISWHPSAPVLAYCGEEQKGTKVGFVRVAGPGFS